MSYYCLGDYRAALTHVRLALEEDPTNQEFAWHMELVIQQNNAEPTSCVLNGRTYTEACNG